MGRKSKLSPEQWAEVDRRIFEGESIRALAREHGISEATIRDRISKIGKQENVQVVAGKIVEAQRSLAALPISAQITAQNLAARLLSISDNLASAAEYGAKTAHRLNALANSEVGKVDDANPLGKESLEAMRGVSAMTKLANEAAATGLNLLAANKDMMKSINTPKEAEAEKPVRPKMSRDEWLKTHGLSKA